jgi:hypothetical protein
LSCVYLRKFYTIFLSTSTEPHTISDKESFRLNQGILSGMFHLLQICGYYVGFEVLTAVVIESAIFWYIAPRSPYFSCRLRSRWFLAQIIFSALKVKAIFPPKRRLTLNGLHGVIQGVPGG